jgi:hypothetical protein
MPGNTIPEFMTNLLPDNDEAGGGRVVSGLMPFSLID